MTRVAYFDCFSGISGDMALGALIDLGVPIDDLRSAIDSMGIADVSIQTSVVKKKGFRAVKVDITHPEQNAHRHLHHVEALIDAGDGLNDATKSLAKRIFHAVAVAEAKVHHTTLQKVHFHEVGAIDSIVDIVGTAFAIDYLGIEAVISSPVPTGGGSITIAHGNVSVPAPATAELLCGIPIAASEIAAELTTPTGAAILKTTATSFGPLPAMTIEAVGYGAGSRDLATQANVLRVLIGRHDDPAFAAVDWQYDRVVVLETNLDDCSPQQLADACERLMSGGALDVFQSPCVMKKGRVGVVLTVVAAPAAVNQLQQIIFAHTTSIGIRRYTAERSKLPRESVIVSTPLGRVRGKVVTLPGGTRRFLAEDDDARALSRDGVRSADDIRDIAAQAWSHGEQDRRSGGAGD